MREEKMKINFEFFGEIRVHINAVKKIERAYLKFIHSKMLVNKQREIVHHGLISKFAKTYLEKGLDESKFKTSQNRNELHKEIKMLDTSTRGSPTIAKKKTNMKLKDTRGFKSEHTKV